ncbi:TPA: hypothetical protein QDA94_000464 [Burkholderia vietnamiensis]|nr:hypothetical protein [Burkholderia vietnamiensis]
MPITDPLVKQSMRVIDTAEDAFIGLLLQKAREAAEQLTWRALITQTIKLTMESFPRPSMNVASANWYGPSWGVAPGPLTVARPDGVTEYEIYLPRNPVQSIESIQYYDMDGTLQTLDPATYLIDSESEPARVIPAPNASWPPTQNRPGAVEIHFVAGYGDDGSSVPAGIKHWILLMTGTLYENREMVAVLNRGKVEMLPYVDSLLTNYAVRTFNPPSYW